MFHKLLVTGFRYYRPSVAPAAQEKILAIRSELASMGVATGASRAKRNGMSSGTAGIGLVEAIERLREAESKMERGANFNGRSSLLLNVKVKLLKEQ